MSKEKIVKGTERTLKYTLYWLFVIYCISLCIPLIWMIFTACKGYMEYYDNPFGMPKKWMFDNFASAMKMVKLRIVKNNQRIVYDIWDMAGVSVTYALLSSFWAVLWTVLTAYAMAKYKFVGRDVIWAIGIFVMVTPLYGSSVSRMTIYKAWGIYDNMFSLIFFSPSTVFCGLYFMLMVSAFKAMPWSYAEAAFIDGAGHFKVMVSIFIPMILPTCAVQFVMDFLSAWNNYGTFLIWLPSYPNLAYGMYFFQANSSLYGSTINEIMAGLAIVAIPTSVLYISCQKLITSKFTVGGLKG